MSPDLAIDIDGISKRYELGSRARYQTLRDSIATTVTAPFRRQRGVGERNEFWALRDVSLQVARGEALGFIGRNGAGKSTLLKILSRIVDPTEGSIEVRGRVGSLLEVGTGFHPELTGRENVALNGAILGMTRAETRAKFDDIVEFAGVEQFIDTPVKRYSSGMHVRLGFAIAAHLEPEVLVVDEVLAVGDAEFQRRCIAKLADVANTGCTVLFVSHNLAVVQSLCSRAVWLDAGRYVDDGNPTAVVERYLASLEELASTDLLERQDRSRRGYHEILLAAVRVQGSEGGGGLATGRPARFEFELTGLLRTTSCQFVVHDHLGIAVASFDSNVPAMADVTDITLASTLVCEIDELTLAPGRYRVDVVVRGGGHLQDGLDGAAYFDVADGTLGGRPATAEDRIGGAVIAHRWRTPPS